MSYKFRISLDKAAEIIPIEMTASFSIDDVDDCAEAVADNVRRLGAPRTCM